MRSYAGRGHSPSPNEAVWQVDRLYCGDDGNYVFADRRAKVVALVILHTPGLRRIRRIDDAGPRHAILFPGSQWETKVEAGPNTIVVVLPHLAQFHGTLEDGDAREMVRRLVMARQASDISKGFVFAEEDRRRAAATQPRPFMVLEVVRDWARERGRTALS